MSDKRIKPYIGITIGDLNGIGPEVIIKALSAQKILDFFSPVIYGSGKVISYYRKLLDLNDFNFAQIKDEQLIPKRVNVVNCWQDNFEIKPGFGDEESGKFAFLALKRACEDLKSQKIHAMVTGPINKEKMPREEFNSVGHTEFISSFFEVKETLMFLVSEQTRVGLVTGHIPLKDVAMKITKSGIESKLRVMEKSLINDFGISKPRIAVLGLNPHAGENGLLGVEENNIISPVIKDFKEHGKLVFGPFPGDGFFGSGQYVQYDGVLAMYHDQGLIGFKTIAFGSGVNFTAGLGVIRTSPDHGTAYSIAGKNKADESSMRAAMMLAYDIALRRFEMVEN
jgi:4-hydroxythreonine-4-phosphate dehydrogenase